MPVCTAGNSSACVSCAACQVRDQENFILNDPSGRPETRRSGAAGTRRIYKVRQLLLVSTPC